MSHKSNSVHLHILFIINFNFLCYPSFWAGNVELFKENRVSEPTGAKLRSENFVSEDLPSFLSKECYRILICKI
jgi:hypothetical protein